MSTGAPTPEDLAGRSERGQAAYNARRRRLRDLGLRVPLDLYDDDEWDDESDPTGAQRFWRRHAAETARNIAQEREWGRQDEHANDRSPATPEDRVH